MFTLLRRFSVIVLAATTSLGCAPVQVADNEETKVKDERCFATGSNLPRRDCRDVVKVDPERVNMPEVRAPRGGLGN